MLNPRAIATLGIGYGSFLTAVIGLGNFVDDAPNPTYPIHPYAGGASPEERFDHIAARQARDSKDIFEIISIWMGMK